MGLSKHPFSQPGLLFWWPVVQPSASTSRWPESSMLLYLFLATLPCDILSGFLVFCDRVVYPVFLSSPRSFGLSALEDQQCAGALMWTCVTVVYLIAGTVFTARLLSPQRSPQRSEELAIPQFDSRRDCGTTNGSAQDGGGLMSQSAVTECSPTAVQERRFGGSTLLSDYWALTKPEVNFLILITTFVGFYLASASDGRVFIRRAIQHFARNVAGSKWDRDPKSIPRTKVRRANAPNRPPSGRSRPSHTASSPDFWNSIGSGGQRLSRDSCQPARECARNFDVGHLSVRVHPAEAKNTNVHSRRSFSGCHAAAYWLGRSLRPIEYRSGDAVRHALFVAVSTFHGNRMDVPRRLRPRRLFGSAQGQCESSFRDFGNSIAAPCSGRYQHHAISDTPRGHFLLCGGSSGIRIHILRMGIRARTFESCCTPAAVGLDCLSSTAVRTKRNIMQSGQMIPWPDLPADSNKESTPEQARCHLPERSREPPRHRRARRILRTQRRSSPCERPDVSVYSRYTLRRVHERQGSEASPEHSREALASVFRNLNKSLASAAW